MKLCFSQNYFIRNDNLRIKGMKCIVANLHGIWLNDLPE